METQETKVFYHISVQSNDDAKGMNFIFNNAHDLTKFKKRIAAK